MVETEYVKPVESSASSLEGTFATPSEPGPLRLNKGQPATTERETNKQKTEIIT